MFVFLTHESHFLKSFNIFISWTSCHCSVRSSDFRLIVFTFNSSLSVYSWLWKTLELSLVQLCALSSSGIWHRHCRTNTPGAEVSMVAFACSAEINRMWEAAKVILFWSKLLVLACHCNFPCHFTVPCLLSAWDAGTMLFERTLTCFCFCSVTLQQSYTAKSISIWHRDHFVVLHL